MIDRKSGCDKCSFGIRRKPETPHMPASLVLIRALQFRRNAIEMCDCANGRAYRSLLQRVVADIESGREYMARSTMILIDAWIDDNPIMPTATGA